MLGNILWSILGFIGLVVVLVLISILWVAFQVRRKMRAVMKSFDHHPTSSARKDVTVIKSETVEDNDDVVK